MPRIKNKQETIVFIKFLWNGNAIGIRKLIGTKGIILPRIFFKAIPKPISLVSAQIVLKGTKFIPNPAYLFILLNCILLMISCIFPVNLITIKLITINK